MAEEEEGAIARPVPARGLQDFLDPSALLCFLGRLIPLHVLASGACARSLSLPQFQPCGRATGRYAAGQIRNVR